jgi:hypothetical protein
VTAPGAPPRPSASAVLCKALIEQLLADHILERLRAAQGVLALLKPYGRDRLEAACARAMAHGSPYYRTVKTILATGADQRTDVPVATPLAYGRTRFTPPPSCSPNST